MGIVRSKLNENPDFLTTPEDSFSWMADDAMPFGFLFGEFFIGKQGGTHGSMPGFYDAADKLPEPRQAFQKPREYLEYSGRLWKDAKIMSFWKYPPKEKFKEVIDEIGKAIDQPNMFNDPKWRVEIVRGLHPDPYGDGSGPENRNIEDDWDWRDEYYDLDIVPLKQYIGSNERSKEDMAKQHVESPMNKLRKPSKTNYVKAGAKKHKPLAWKQAMYAESAVTPSINESPDMIEADNLKDITGKPRLDWNGTGAFPFGYFFDKMWTGKDDDTHEDMGKRYNKETNWERDHFDLAGRVWPWEKIISFWDYPKPEQLKKVLEDIVAENRRKYGDSNYVDFSDPNWSIEIITKTLQNKGWVDPEENEWHQAAEAKLIPLSKYSGSESQSAEDKAKQHIESPMNKMKKADKSDYVKVSDKKTKPLAWKQALVKSESMTLHEKLLMGEPVTIEELRDVLHKKVLNFEFIKLDGEVRPAKGTTMMKYIPKEEHPTGEHPSSDKVAAFYDLSKSAWRSVSNRSDEIILVQDEETGKIKVRVSDKVPKEEPKEKKPEISKVPGADPRPIPPKEEPIVRPSIRPEVTPEIPDIDDLDVDEPETPLDIEDPNITADDVEDQDIVAPGTEEPEVELPEPQTIPPVEPETPMEPAVSPSIKPEPPDEELPPEEDITFPEDDDEDIM